MASKRELEDRLSRMEAIGSRESEAESDEMKMLRAMPLADLRRLEGLIMRVESGDPSEALTAPELAWLAALGYDVEAIPCAVT